MAICEYQRIFIKDYVLSNTDGKNMLELGDQVFDTNSMPKTITYSVAKPYYESLGYNHTSIDTNGNNGSINHDLTKENEIFNNHFDITTNHGTTEHIQDQYSVFKNLHNWGKIGCLYAHVVPLHPEEHIKLLGRPFPRHGLYEYHTDFWRSLCEACGYEMIIATTEVRNPALKYPLNYYSSSVYKKTEKSQFIDKNKFEEIKNKYIKNC